MSATLYAEKRECMHPLLRGTEIDEEIILPDADTIDVARGMTDDMLAQRIEWAERMVGSRENIRHCLGTISAGEWARILIAERDRRAMDGGGQDLVCAERVIRTIGVAVARYVVGLPDGFTMPGHHA